jgi:hypothetical protein
MVNRHFCQAAVTSCPSVFVVGFCIFYLVMIIISIRLKKL